MRKVILTVVAAMFMFGGLAQANICELNPARKVSNPIVLSEKYNDGFGDSCKAQRTGNQRAVDSERVSSDSEYLRGVNHGIVVCSNTD